MAALAAKTDGWRVGNGMAAAKAGVGCEHTLARGRCRGPRGWGGVRLRVGVWTGVLGGVLEVGVLGGIPRGVLGGVVVVVVVVVGGQTSDVRRPTSQLREGVGWTVVGGRWLVDGWTVVGRWTGGRVDGCLVGL